jgi:hypothetical protein
LSFACDLDDRDEFECEQAVAHLSECCPGFRPGELACRNEQGCGSETHAALDMDESSCLQEKTCDALVAEGLCGRAQAARSIYGGTERESERFDYERKLRAKASVCP